MRNIEHGQTADHRGNQGEQQDGTQTRQGDPEEGLEPVRAVNRRRLEQRRVNPHYACNQDDHRVPVPHPELDEGDYAAGCRLILQEEDWRITPAQHLKQAVDRTHRIGEQGTEQHGNRTCSDDIRHIEQNLEQALSFDVQTLVREPGGQQERKGHLRNKVGNPQEEGIDQGLAE